MKRYCVEWCRIFRAKLVSSDAFPLFNSVAILFILVSGVSCADQQARPSSDQAGFESASAASDSISDAENGGQGGEGGFTFEHWRANRLPAGTDIQDLAGPERISTANGAEQSEAPLE